jgi:hypothetical protein
MIQSQQSQPPQAQVLQKEGHNKKQETPLSVFIDFRCIRVWVTISFVTSSLLAPFFFRCISIENKISLKREKMYFYHFQEFINDEYAK